MSKPENLLMVVPCRRCGAETDYGEELDNDWYCADCAEDMTQCGDCDRWFPRDDMLTAAHGMICEDCSSEYCDCYYCGGLFPGDDVISCGDRYACDTCAEREWYRCDDCADWTIEDHGDSCRYLCESCRESYFWCDGCESLCGENEYGENGYCINCCEGEEISGLHSYNFKPPPIFKGSPKNGLYYGIELEIEREDGAEVPADIEGDGAYFYLKRDGSLDCGFEVVSHPASWKWLKDHDGIWDEVLELRHENYRSYSTSTCGMHVHLSKAAFSSFQLYKWLHFFHTEVNFVTAISQRRSENLQQWASLDGGNDSILYKAKGKAGGRRYEAINLTNPNTVEVRIFRGTLAPSGFWRNLEFLEALFRWLEGFRALDVGAISAGAFCDYVVENRWSYPNLCKWLVKKGYVEEDAICALLL